MLKKTETGQILDAAKLDVYKILQFGSNDKADLVSDFIKIENKFELMQRI
jgi:hypothetical protein